MKYLYLFLTALLLSSCNVIQIRKKSDVQVQKRTKTYSTQTTPKKVEVINTSPTKVTTGAVTNVSYSAVVNSAKNYLGTPYRSGGTSKSGMDCSGLVITSFQENGIDIPRISRDQANAGKTISISEAQPGDLVFFNTSGSGISHVGIVERIENGTIYFIHSSSSKGVIISSLEEKYWKPKHVKTVRIN